MVSWILYYPGLLTASADQKHKQTADIIYKQVAENCVFADIKLLQFSATCLYIMSAVCLRFWSADAVSNLG